MPKLCNIRDCDKTVLARGYCSSHYHRLVRHGDPLVTKYTKHKPIKIGQVFGRLTIIEQAPSNARNQQRWKVQCQCGNETIVMAHNLHDGHTTSCGQHGPVVHGLTDHPLYPTWLQMQARCYQPKQESYKWYGGRGIRVEDEWLGPQGLVNFIRDMGPKPTPQHSIDRIDNDGNYCAANCKWSTPKEQAANRRKPNQAR